MHALNPVRVVPNNTYSCQTKLISSALRQNGKKPTYKPHKRPFKQVSQQCDWSILKVTQLMRV